MLKIICKDREKLNGLQTDITGYMLAGVIWRSENEAQRTLWCLWYPLLKILVKSVELLFWPITYDKGNKRFCVTQFEIM